MDFRLRSGVEPPRRLVRWGRCFVALTSVLDGARRSIWEGHSGRRSRASLSSVSFCLIRSTASWLMSRTKGGGVFLNGSYCISSSPSSLSTTSFFFPLPNTMDFLHFKPSWLRVLIAHGLVGVCAGGAGNQSSRSVLELEYCVEPEMSDPVREGADLR